MRPGIAVALKPESATCHHSKLHKTEFYIDTDKEAVLSAT